MLMLLTHIMLIVLDTFENFAVLIFHESHGPTILTFKLFANDCFSVFIHKIEAKQDEWFKTKHVQ